MTPQKPLTKKPKASSNSLITLNQSESKPSNVQSFHMSKPQTLSAPRLSLPISQPLYYIIFTHNYLVGAAPSKIVVYSFLDKRDYNIKVSTSQFVLVDFPPYVFGCFITQFLYLYSEQALNDVSKIIKIKISKLNVMAICSYNKGYFMGGYNRSPLPGGNLINKRTIYFVQNLTSDNKNKPQWQISIPKNNNPITILQMQNPYLMCYCEPHTYIINPQVRQVLISFQKQFSCLSLLQGRYSLNCVNMIGISLKQRTLISVDIQRYPIYGVELNELKQKASSVCQSRQGIIFACYKNTIFSYNIFKKQKKIVKAYEEFQQVIQLICSPKNVLVVLIISREPKQDENGFMHYGSIIDIQKQRLQDMPKSLDYVMIGGKSVDNQRQKTASMSINRQIQEKRIIQVFSITL